MILQGKQNVFETELFSIIIEELEKLSRVKKISSLRIIADHLRTSIMIIKDGVKPSNIDRGYILRRLLRRCIRHLRKVDIDINKLEYLTYKYIEILKEMYPEVEKEKDEIVKIIIEEKDKFIKTLEKGEKEFNKALNYAILNKTNKIEAKTVFNLYETYGFPQEMTEELAKEANIKIDKEGFEKLYQEHQEKSRQGAKQKFQGGLAEANEKTISYHTATHLLQKALKIVLGEHVNQKGSNITTERLRFDFSHPQKMTEDEIKKVEDIVNEQIKKELIVSCQEMTEFEARKLGATGLFADKYKDKEKVKVYKIGDFSMEICGGPHVENTVKLGKFKIQKEEASSSRNKKNKSNINRLK